MVTDMARLAPLAKITMKRPFGISVPRSKVTINLKWSLLKCMRMVMESFKITSKLTNG